MITSLIFDIGKTHILFIQCNLQKDRKQTMFIFAIVKEIKVRNEALIEHLYCECFDDRFPYKKSMFHLR